MMLTSKQALARLDYSTGRIYPDKLKRSAHGHYLKIAERLLDIYRNGIGLTRQQLHQLVQVVFDDIDDCPSRRISAFIKLLDEVSNYQTDRGRLASELRQKVFRAAAPHHPLVEVGSGVFGNQQWEVKHQIARHLEQPWSQIERCLFADVLDFHTLLSFEGYASGAEFLARYNVAQLQACLYRAARMTLWANSDLKRIVRLIKLSRLMHSISRLPGGTYQFVVDGPASTLRVTRRYGVAMAKIVPGLLSCSDWRMSAQILSSHGKGRLSLQISSRDGLTSPKIAEEEFDSEVEADLMRKWNEVSLPGWSLSRESELLVQGQKVFTPDFVLTHESGRQVIVEVVGFWTPEYIRAKVETLARFPDHDLLLIAKEDLRSALSELPESLFRSVLWYKTTIPIKQFHQAILAT